MPLVLGRNPKATLIRAAMLIATAWVVFGVLLLPVRMEGISMMPTYSGGINFANRFAYRLSPPERGDPVVVRMAGAGAVYVKRVVGLPGERIAIEAGVVLIDGEPLLEPHVLYKTMWSMDEVTVGPDEYFLIGDNRGMPMKYHDFGKASRERIIGKMIF